MRRLHSVIIGMIIAISFWLCDSLLFTIANNCTFGAALWVGVSSGRLLFRLAITLTVLLVCFTHLLRKELEYIRVLHMGEEAKIANFGESESRDKNKRILYYALRLATLMKMPAREQHNLRILCYCHNIGLVGLPANVLYKKERLTENERQIWDKHAQIGAEIAAKIPKISRASHLIACHEERYNGSGPLSMYGKSIPLACRIFAAVEMFDNFTHPYYRSPGMSVAEAIDEINLYAGTALDPDVVAALGRLVSDHRLVESITVQVYMR